MRVNFLDLRATYQSIQAELEDAILGSLRSGWYIGGPAVETFETAYATYCEVAHCVTVANGLDALRLALAALDIGTGDEVIVPTNTFIATWLAVSQCGATCVPVEPNPRTYNIDPELIEAAITKRTRAIIPVHLYGQPADLDAIGVIAARHGIAVVEDAAQAQGAHYKGKRIGGHSPLVTWSFYPGKNLGALGDAGAITTNDSALAERLRLLRNYGSPVRYEHREPGFNSRMDPVQAAALTVKLRYLDEWNARRTSVAAAYSAAFDEDDLVTPHVESTTAPAWHLYCVLHQQRDALRVLLNERGVETLIHYPKPPHLQGAFNRSGWQRGSFPLTERIAQQILSLPIDPLMSEAAIEHVIASVNDSVRSLR